jgi:hypothetical protein
MDVMNKFIPDGLVMVYLFGAAFRGVASTKQSAPRAITPALRSKAKKALPAEQEKTRAQKHQSITFAQRLKRVFGIEIETCEQCGGAVKVIASIDKSSGKPICTANAAPQGCA